jgi:hypothetical protein
VEPKYNAARRVEMSDEDLFEAYEARGRNAAKMCEILLCKPRAARQRMAGVLSRLGHGPMILEQSDPTVENLIMHELAKSSIAPEGSTVTQAWIKGKHLSVNLRPDNDAPVPRWPVVQQVEPKIVQYLAPTIIIPKTIRIEAVLPDTQFGYQRVLDSRKQVNMVETYDMMPMHDERALDVSLQILNAVRPTGVTHVGDIMDFSEFSKYIQVEQFFRTTQAGLDRAHTYLCDIRSIVGPDAPIRLVDGNHDDKRIATYIQLNARAAFNLRPANTTPETWGDQTLGHLLRLDEIGVSRHGVWPGSFVYLIEGENALVVTHDPQKKGFWQASVISGHTHHRREESYIMRTPFGQRSYTHYEIGCLCSITTNPDPRAIQRTKVPSDRGFVSGWAQGLAIVEIVVETGQHRLDFIPIHGGSAVYCGQVFEAQQSSEAA